MDEVTQAINHFSVLMEDQNAKLDAVLEHLGDIPKIQDFRRLEQKVDTLSADMAVLKASAKTTNREVAGLSRDLENHKGLPAHLAHGHA